MSELNERILIRFASEVFIKSSRTRSRFVDRLVRNLTDALKSRQIDYELERTWDRLEFRVADHGPALEVLSRVFGAGPLLPIELTTGPELETIVDEGARAFGEQVRGKKFAVRARRRGAHSFSSRDVEQKLGARLDETADHVDLDNPEVTVHVEVDEDEAIFYTRKLDGARGLPIGTEGRAVSLISGGFDSAVASWLALRRGTELDFLFCNLAGRAYERVVLRVAKELADEWCFGYEPRLYVVDFTGPVKALRRNVRGSYRQLVLKRLMYRAGEHVADRVDAQALITGESVGQVSSQTLTNLRAIDAVAERPVIRPLVGLDKEEIIARAREIGTASLSEKVKEYCAISPGNPVTAASVEDVDAEEAALEPDVLEEPLEEIRTIDLRNLSLGDYVAEYVFMEELPEDAVLIDCQSEQAYENWCVPEAEHWAPWKLRNQYHQLEKEPVYVLYCARGVQSAYIAEMMQEEGYDAYSFRGGAPALRRYLERDESELVEDGERAPV